MSLEFNRYLQPCSNGVDLQLVSVYSPYVKPLRFVHDANSSRSCCSMLNEIPSDSCDERRHQLHNDVISFGDNSSTVGIQGYPTSETNVMSSKHVTSSLQCLWACSFEDENLSRQPKPFGEMVSGSPSIRSRDIIGEKVQSPSLENSSGIHRKLSLPILSRSLSDIGDKGLSADGDDDCRGIRRCKTSSFRRRHVSSGVKFADEVGENLTTFAIIPSRFDEHQTDSKKTIESQTPFDTKRRRTPMCPHSPENLSAVYCPRCRADENDSSSSLSSTSSDDSAFPGSTENAPVNRSTDGRLNGPSSTFHMLFEQPAADPLKFHGRLDSQSVCLENVKVVESCNSYGSGDTLPTSVAVLCTARVKHCVTVCGKSMTSTPCDDRRLFARWTDDDWQSYADIWAQCISSVSSTSPSSEYVATYSFAVNLHPASLSSAQRCNRRVVGESGGRRKVASQLCRDGLRSKSQAATAVEFALCYAVNNLTFWDNNDGKNYRIEWR